MLFYNVYKCVRKRFQQYCEGLPINELMVPKKPNDSAKELGFSDFKASNNWLEKLQNEVWHCLLKALWRKHVCANKYF